MTSGGWHRPVGIGVALLGVLVTGACGSSGSGSQSQSPTSSPQQGASSPTPTIAAGPPTAQLSAVGSYTLSVGAASGTITCMEPSLDGESIVVAVGTSTAGVSGLVTVRAGFVNVRIRMFQGGNVSERDFSGSGVMGFSAAGGAQLQSQLSETAGLFGYPKGTLGALSAISGMISCGNQQPGSGNVTVAGQTEDGSVSGTLQSIRVVCTTDPSGMSVRILGLTHAGSAPALVDVSVMSGGGVNLEEEVGSAFHEYSDIMNGGVAPAGDATASGHGAHLSATVTESGSAQPIPSPAPMLMVGGDVTCAS